MANNKPQHILWIIDSLPLSTEKAREDLDVIFMLAAFDIKITLLFIEQGIFQLLNTDHSQIKQRAFTPLLMACKDYEIENLYVLNESLIRFNLTPNDFTMPISLIYQKDLAKLRASVDYIIR
jgi:tRNA 2-thiouridine synthesizing protein C